MPQGNIEVIITMKIRTAVLHQDFTEDVAILTLSKFTTK